jgi:DNA-binding beta-propeller fold protein YncE
MPPVVDPANIYSETAIGKLSVNVDGAKEYVYVPSTDDGTITVIDQNTLGIVDTIQTGGKLVQHVVAGYDMKMLYANVSGNNSLFEIDPMTGKATGRSIPVPAPYNLYWTPDGTKAIVMAERLDRIDVYDRATWTKVSSTAIPCKSQMPGASYGGVNHADWSADGSYFLATCEFAGDMIKVETATMQVVDEIHLSDGAMPQDVRVTPDGSKFYVADMALGGLWVLDAGAKVTDRMKVIKRIYTAKGTHGLYPSRDGSVFYVANRGHLANETGRKSKPKEGSVSVVDWHTDKVTATWTIPGGGSPDMGGVSADGATLWLSGRYDAEVYAFDTKTGILRTRIPVPPGPHGLAVFPQPGRYSLGHTGNYR